MESSVSTDINSSCNNDTLTHLKGSGAVGVVLEIVRAHIVELFEELFADVLVSTWSTGSGKHQF